MFKPPEPPTNAVNRLSQLPAGSEFRVIGVILPREIGKRLSEMGFVHGTSGRVIRKALLGDPMQILILGYQVSIRKSEAAGIEVEAIIPPQPDGIRP